MTGEPIEQKKHPHENDDWWNTVEVKAEGPKGDPEADQARAALHKHRAKLAAAEAAEIERRARQMADIANKH
jgi:hypothetical protein